METSQQHVGSEACRPQLELWLLASELEGERASSHRQFRWCECLLDAGFFIEAFSLNGAIRISHRTIRSRPDLVRLRHDIRVSARPTAGVREGLAARALRHVKHWLLMDLWLPNVLALLVQLLLRRPSIDGRVVILASSPPFSVVIVGALLRAIRRRHFLLAVDMRDAWAHHRALGGPRRLKKWIERVTLSRADACVTVSNQLAGEFHPSMCSVEVAYNVATHVRDADREALGLDWSSLDPALLASSAKLVYTGSIPEGFYDLSTIMGGIRHAVESGHLRRERNQIVFVGACDPLRRMIQDTELEWPVVFLPHQPSRVARLIQAHADALLFLGYNDDGNGGVVSTKLFEYLSLGRPILPIMVRADSDVDTLLSRYGGQRIHAIGPQSVGELLVAWASGAAMLPRCRDLRSMDDLLKPYRNFCDCLAGMAVARVPCA